MRGIFIRACVWQIGWWEQFMRAGACWNFALAIIPVVLGWSAPSVGAPQNTSDSSAPESLIEVIVTSRKREERLQDVPVSVDVFSGEEIEGKSVETMRELAQFSPNLSFVNSPTRGSGAVFIRGVGQLETDAQFEPGVGIYQDGVYIAFMQGLDLELMDVQRVEVLRGPQGTLFGKNTSGGAVNFVTARPNNVLGGRAEITAGSFNRRDAKLSINVPLIPGTLRSRFSAAARNRDGYGERLDLASGNRIDRAGDTDNLSGRALFNWIPTDAVDVLFSIDGRRSRNGADVTKLSATRQTPLIAVANSVLAPDFGDIFLTDDEYQSYATGPDAFKIDAWNTALTATWELTGWQVKSISAYRELDLRAGRDIDGSPYRLVEQHSTWAQRQLSQEVQLSGVSLDSRLTWLGGLYYLSSRSDDIRYTILMEPVYQAIGRDIGAIAGILAEKKSYAAFGNVTYAWTERLNLSGGLRWNRDTADVVDKLATFPLSGAIRHGPVPGRFEDDGLNTGHIGLDVDWSDTVMSYLSFARGYKAGVPNAAAYQPADPEYVLTYEIGVKSQRQDGRLRLNAAVFYSDYTALQFQVNRFDPNSGQFISVLDNAGKAEIKGFEAQLEARPLNRLNVSLSLGHTDAKFVRLQDVQAVTLSSKFVATPEWTVAAASQYSIPLADRGSLTARVDYAHRSAAEYDTANNPVGHQDPYGLLSARLGYENAKGNWLLSVSGTNLTDERYLLSGISFLESLGFASQQYGRPREWGVSLSYTY